MRTFEVKNYITNAVIWSCESACLTNAIQAAVAQNISLEEANLEGAILRGASIWNANLQKANLQKANLQEANLKRADLRGANLEGAYLWRAILEGANFEGANLEKVNLERAILNKANFKQTNLIEANFYEAFFDLGTNLEDANLPNFQIPQNEELTVYKKLLCRKISNASNKPNLIEYNVIATLRIPSRTARTASLVGSSPEMRAKGEFGKCRAERAFVVAIENYKGEPIKSAYSLRNYNFVYEVGKEVKTEEYNSNILIECASGIHFFMTKEEAKDFNLF
jgi:uncharacterized protein YjbI with pentapeptide repeats